TRWRRSTASRRLPATARCGWWSSTTRPSSSRCRSSRRTCSSPRLATVGAGGHTGPLTKRVAKRCLRGVAGHLRCFRERCSFAQKGFRLLHSQARQVAERRLTDQLCESRREGRTGEADSARQRGHRPLLLELPMHETERRAHVSVPERSKKSFGPIGEALD